MGEKIISVTGKTLAKAEYKAMVRKDFKVWYNKKIPLIGQPMFSGSIVALVTPFNQGKVDETALKSLVNWHRDEGTQGIVALGSTGEGALLTPEERLRVLSSVIETAGNRIPVIAGCGSPSTAEAVNMVQQAQTLGAAAALVVTPYYVKPGPEGIFQHFQAISETSSLPLIIYNNPGRCGIDLSVPLISRLATLSTVAGLKDSSTDLARPALLREAISKDFCLLSGDDPTAGPYLAQGGDGCISVTANIAPRLCQEMMKAWDSRTMPEFAKIQEQLMPLHEALATEVNPCPVKFGLSLLGRCRNELRLPLLPVTSATGQLVAGVMSVLELIHSHGNSGYGG